MEYKDLLDAHLKYGTTKEDIIKRYDLDKILENVIVAPWWGHEIFENMGFEVEQVSEKIYNFKSKDLSFSFAELKGIGAPYVMDFVLGLGVTKCKNLIFVGSAGALDESMKIGDIVVPEYSICGDGASRYLNKNMEDEFLKKEYPTKELTDELIRVVEEDNIKYHYVPNFSVDTIFAQFLHIDDIIAMGAKSIEMESANLFKCNELLNVNVTAMFCISDNTVIRQSLYSGRREEDKIYRKKVINEVIPDVTVKLLKRVK